jgi:regulator of cell morphogenesis and NO signaling
MGALEALGSPTEGDEAPTAAWPLDRLIDYIVTRHHAFVRESLPVITSHIRKIVTVHGEAHPELARVERGFASLAQELTVHMMKEEQILFPYVRALVTAERTRRHIGEGPFGTVQNPIRMMEAEHQSAGNELRTLRDLTAGYTVPDNGCATYRACFDELREFESDLQRHIHLENNILFPAAIELEQRLS